MDALTQRFHASIPGVLLLHGKEHADERGMFSDLWDERELPGYGNGDRPWRMSITCSNQWVVRGLHYQLDPVGGSDIRDRMAKVVTCLAGNVLDVLVDLRLRSPAFGQRLTLTLAAPGPGQQPVSVFIPPGVAHGYIVRSQRATMLYGFSTTFVSTRDRALLWNDPALGIDWGLPHGAIPILSAKDRAGITLEQYISGNEVFDEEA